MRRKRLRSAIWTFLSGFSILLGFEYLTGQSFLPLSLNGHVDESKSTPKHGHLEFFKMAPKYLNAIMDPKETSFPRLECPAPKASRYEYLRNNKINILPQKKYFFALDLHDCAALLPRLLGSIVETMLFLGPHNCALSIIEGRSNDGTFEILKLLRSRIEGMGAAYYFDTNDVNTEQEGADRVKRLAVLRNLALTPLWRNSGQYAPDTTVVFLNDVAICMEDVLELIHQRVHQDADMVCAMDWTYVGQDPTFYDVWIARDMKGESFFNIPKDGNWNSAWNLFWNNEDTLERYLAYKPFQVFSCWNGATAFTATPILDRSIRFRSSHEDEFYQGEPFLFCKDMWHVGYGKIAVVPSVNIEYSDERAKQIKEWKGYVSDVVMREVGNEDLIEWDSKPPAMVKCMLGYDNQEWRPWNESLT